MKNFIKKLKIFFGIEKEEEKEGIFQCYIYKGVVMTDQILQRLPEKGEYLAINIKQGHIMEGRVYFVKKLPGKSVLGYPKYRIMLV